MMYDQGGYNGCNYGCTGHSVHLVLGLVMMLTLNTSFYNLIN